MTEQIVPVVEGQINKEEINKLQPEQRIAARGYRSYVGGHNPEKWYGIGKLQYHFLISRGLKNTDLFLDIGCGSLRLGMYLIPFLDAGNYFGLEPEKLLVESGLSNEFNFNICKIKKPSFAFNYDFDFSFIDTFDYAMANSIFTHLAKDDIAKCFANLKKKTNANSVFYCTFFEGNSSNNKFDKSHANRRWEYSFKEICELSEDWQLEYIGNWNHPVNQKIIKCCPC